MHHSFFEVKQAHLAAVRFGRRESGPLGLTPARMDMLRAIRAGGGKLLQGRLRHLLGVSRTVVSIMVRALETLGFVTRAPSKDDRRTLVVELTDRANIALRILHHETEIMGFMDLALVSAFTRDHFFVKGWRNTVARFAREASRVRAAFGIGDTWFNPWNATENDEAFYFAPVDGNPNRLHRFDDPEDEPDGGPAVYLEA